MVYTFWFGKENYKDKHVDCYTISFPPEYSASFDSKRRIILTIDDKKYHFSDVLKSNDSGNPCIVLGGMQICDLKIIKSYTI